MCIRDSRYFFRNLQMLQICAAVPLPLHFVGRCRAVQKDCQTAVAVPRPRNHMYLTCRYCRVLEHAIRIPSIITQTHTHTAVSDWHALNALWSTELKHTVGPSLLPTDNWLHFSRYFAVEYQLSTEFMYRCGQRNTQLCLDACYKVNFVKM